MRIGKFDGDVFLFDAREFAVKLIAVLNLLDVELWRESANGGEGAVLGGEMAVVVVDETE